VLRREALRVGAADNESSARSGNPESLAPRPEARSLRRVHPCDALASIHGPHSLSLRLSFGRQISGLE